MNASEPTPTDPGTDLQQTAVDSVTADTAAALRSLRGAARRVHEAGPREREKAVADTRDFVRELASIFDRQAALLEQLTRREAETLRDLAAVKENRPRDWFEYAMRGLVALLGSSAITTFAANHHDLAFGLAMATAAATYLAQSPRPPREK